MVPKRVIAVVLLILTLTSGVSQILPYYHVSAVVTGTSIIPKSVRSTSTPSDNWPTYHRDNLRSGYDPTLSSFASVNLNWKSPTLDGDVYAEPLVVGADVVVATEQNSVYELNATNGQIIWHINLGTPVNGGVLPCGDINPSGITSTPAIDVSGGTIYVVAFLSSPSLHHELFGINLGTGVTKFQLAIDPSGSNPTVQQQRGALTLANGYVYVPYGGLDGDCGSYHGWIAATSANGTGQVISYQVPTGNAGAIWGGGDGPAIDSSGNVLVATGNSFSTTTFDYGDAVLKLSPATSSPISLLDWFAPSNWAQLNQDDLDLGSTEPVVLNSNYLFQIGKGGVGYVLNATNLGHVGGQVYSSQVCTSGHGAYGGLAYSSPYLVVPCDNGVVVLNMNLGPNPSFTVFWRGPNYLAGPPITAGNAVWDVDVSDGLIYAFSLSNGHTIFQATIGSLPTHFNSLSAGDGQIFVPTTQQILAYLPQQKSATLTTDISTGSGSVTPSCPGPTGCSETVGSPISVAATAALAYMFASWTVTGASCSSGSTSNPCTFTMPNNAVTVSATFTSAVTMTVSYSVLGGGTPTAPTFNYVQLGIDMTLTLTGTPTAVQADQGSSWSVTNPLQGSTTSERWWTAQPAKGKATSTKTISFMYEHQYHLSMNTNPPTEGTVTPKSGWQNSGASVSIQATPNTNFAFVSWTGSGTGSFTGTGNPATITLNGPISETAKFQQASGQLTVNLLSPTNGTTVTSSPVAFRLTVAGSVQGATVTVYVDGSQACSGSTSSTGSFSCKSSVTKTGGIHSWYATATKTGFTSGTSPTWTFTY